MLESLKWLSAEDLLQAAAVSQAWNAAAESEEVWDSILTAKSQGELLPPTLSLCPNSKELYRALYTQFYIPVVYHTKYAQFDIRSKRSTIQELSTQTRITRASYMLYLPDQSLFACGGDVLSHSYYDSGLRSAYRILPIQWTVMELTDMNGARRYPGAYYYKGCVYVFGGSDGTKYLNSAEQFSLSSNTWQDLPNCIVPRNSLTPVMHGLEIYLVGGSKTNIIEAFHVTKRTYRQLPLTLPGSVDCTCLLTGSSLTALTMQRALSIDLATEQVTSTVSIPSHDYVWSNAQPLCYKGEMWFYYWHFETVVSFDFGKRFQQHHCFNFNLLER